MIVESEPEIEDEFIEDYDDDEEDEDVEEMGDRMDSAFDGKLWGLRERLMDRPKSGSHVEMEYEEEENDPELEEN